ncbi:helix-turn-helix domain-containing protein [Denitrificimonas halotolerans]|uniref:helix-turn-helix domain-containing protein n=1 Tax=Denitrificimonas halotolerans TaxID=3098930 RepID=UPI003899010F
MQENLTKTCGKSCACGLQPVAIVERNAEILKAIKRRIYLTSEQAEFLSRKFGMVRFTYNAGFAS